MNRITYAIEDLVLNESDMVIDGLKLYRVFPVNALGTMVEDGYVPVVIVDYDGEDLKPFSAGVPLTFRLA